MLPAGHLQRSSPSDAALQQALQPIEALVNAKLHSEQLISKLPGPEASGPHTHKPRLPAAAEQPSWCTWAPAVRSSLRASRKPQMPLSGCATTWSLHFCNVAKHAFRFGVLIKDATYPTVRAAASQQAAAGSSHAAGMRLSGYVKMWTSTAATGPRLPACRGGLHS